MMMREKPNKRHPAKQTCPPALIIHKPDIRSSTLRIKYVDRRRTLEGLTFSLKEHSYAVPRNQDGDV